MDMFAYFCRTMPSEKFRTGGKVDFRKKSAFRNYPLQVGNVTFFVNPHVLSQISPVFEVMTLGEKFVENRDLKACLEDETPEDIEIFLEAVCPTYYGIYPKNVTDKTFMVLARLADKFLVDGLKCSCEEFLVQYSGNDLSANVLLKMLITCCSFNFCDRSKKMLLQKLLKIRKDHFSVDDELKKFEVGQIVQAEINKTAFPGHSILTIPTNFGHRWPCEKCKLALLPLSYRCDLCRKRVCVKCSNSVCFSRLNSRVNHLMAEIELIS